MGLNKVIRKISVSEEEKMSNLLFFRKCLHKQLS